MGRTTFRSEDGLKKGAWTAEEDQKLIAYIQKHGEGSWRSLPEKAGLQRCGKSCRLRWANYLRPGIKRGDFTSEEDETIIQLHAKLGSRWAAIARHLPKRTDNEIKNYWNAHLKKRLASMGIDPVTHKPLPAGSSSTGNSYAKPAPMAESSTAKATHESEATFKQPKSRTSALLLNKLATRATILQCADVLRACQSFTGMQMSSPTSNICQGNNNTSSACPDNDISDNFPMTITPLDCLDALLSPESEEYYNADYNIEPPSSDSDALSNILPEISNNAGSEPDETELASLLCMDVFHDRQNDLPAGGPSKAIAITLLNRRQQAMTVKFRPAT